MQTAFVTFALVFLSAQAHQTTERSSPMLVAEGANHSMTDGVLELRGSRGWLRTSSLHVDFWLTFEFRAHQRTATQVSCFGPG
jgi:hypothetical protein